MLPSRALPLDVVDDWLDNWSRWCRGDRLPTMEVCDVGEWYQSPERNHHEPPRSHAPVRPVYVDAAMKVERLVRVLPADQVSALRACCIAWPDAVLRRSHVAPERWNGRRARAARLPVSDYRQALDAARERLARELWPYGRLMPRCA